jgi:membrane dipeptidase
MIGNRYFTAADAELTRKIGIFNSHDDFPLIMAKQRFDGVYDSLRTYWLPQFRAGGVSVVVGAIFTPTIYVPEGALRHALWVLDGLFTEIEENRDDIEVALSVADIQRINTQGKIAVLVALEGAEPLGQDLSTLRLLYRLGLRVVSLTHARRTLFGDGNFENVTRGGLSRAGRRAVKEMNRLGIIVDVTHASDQTTWDILEVATKPVIASHSNARTVQDHLRNVTDDMIRAIAAKGGVLGAVAVPSFVTDGEPTISRWVDHIEHIVTLVGIDHVGVGTDFFHYGWTVGAAPGIAEADWGPRSGYVRSEFAGMQSPEDLPGLTMELRKRGFSEGDLRKVYRDNYLRVMAAVTEGG